MNIEELVRENIKGLKPYSSARHEFAGQASIYLDANENAFGSPLTENYNRYPDPNQTKLKGKLSSLKNIPVENIFLGNGSDEAIDLLFRIFCRPGKDKIIICPPSYGIYETCAVINDTAVIKVNLTANFQLDTEGILKQPAKLLFICSPNNPTGNIIGRTNIETILRSFPGIVVIDEAYIHYSRQNSYIGELENYPNLVVLQTLSKAWGLAGLRLGMAFASATIINYMNKVKFPYNINTATQDLVLQALSNDQLVDNWTRTTIGQRKWLREQLATLPFIQKVYPSDANFILIKTNNSTAIYIQLLAKGIVTRLRDDDLRITVGTSSENDTLIKELKALTL